MQIRRLLDYGSWLGPGTIFTLLMYPSAKNVQVGIFEHGGFESAISLPVGPSDMQIRHEWDYGSWVLEQHSHYRQIQMLKAYDLGVSAMAVSNLSPECIFCHNPVTQTLHATL